MLIGHHHSSIKVFRQSKVSKNVNNKKCTPKLKIDICYENKNPKNFLSWKLDNPHYRLVKSQKVFMQRFLHFLRFANQHLADIGDQLACIKIPSVVELETAEMI